MHAEPLRMYAILISNAGIRQEEKELEEQMQGLQPGSDEYTYDQLQLEREQRELQIRQEHPDLDPQTLSGNSALEQLLNQDPTYQAILQQIESLVKADPFESSNWGIPMAFQDAKFIEINS